MNTNNSVIDHNLFRAHEECSEGVFLINTRFPKVVYRVVQWLLIGGKGQIEKIFLVLGAKVIKVSITSVISRQNV